jgi:hypothetical protein
MGQPRTAEINMSLNGRSHELKKPRRRGKFARPTSPTFDDKKTSSSPRLCPEAAKTGSARS